MLGCVGLPIYLHAPKYFSDTYNLSLAMLGVVMFVLRVLDFIQDPLLGRLSTLGMFSHRTLSIGASSAIILGASGLFLVAAPISPVVWFALSLVMLFTGYSLSVILIYAYSANNFDETVQPIIARWREAGQLIGICASAIAPTLFGVISHKPYVWMAWFLTAITVMATGLMYQHWLPNLKKSAQKFVFAEPDARIRPYLLLAFTNAIPVAITSTLFLFYVEHVIGSPDASGPLLLLFFGSAALAVPIWSLLVNRYRIEWVLGLAMCASLIAFVFTFSLGEGDVAAFAVICLMTGVLTGADLTLLPMIFINSLQRNNVPSEEAFGYWSLSSKLALAMVVGAVLPGLELFGFDPSAPTEQGIYSLSVAYAIVPTILKFCAIFVLWYLMKIYRSNLQGANL